jgi:hypothetical protein
MIHVNLHVATPLWVKCGKLESYGTPKNLELDCKGQISLHLSVLGVVGKVLKCRCPKWPRMNYLDIWSPSYGQKKSRESNWQFDPWPLKVKLAVWPPTTKSQESTSSWRPLTKCDMELESSRGELQLWFKPRLDRRSGREVMVAQSPGSPNRDSFGTPLWESRDKKPFGCSLCKRTQRILHGGRWWLPPSLGRGESSVSKCPWLVPTPKGVPECELTLLWLVLDVDSSLII